MDKNLCANADGRAAGEWIDLSLRSHQAADCSGRSTNSHSERPLHLWHRGKLASLSSATSSPQHSEAYSPGSMTSCPVFISLPLLLSRSVLHARTLSAKPEIRGVTAMEFVFC